MFKKLLTRISFFIFFFSLFAYIVSVTSTTFANLFHKNISVPLRILLHKISAPFSPSLFEAVIIASPIFIIIAFLYILRSRGRRELKRRFFTLLSTAALLSSLYIITLGISARADDVVLSHIKIDGEPTYEEIEEASQILLTELNTLVYDSPHTLKNTAEKIVISAKSLNVMGQRHIENYKPKPLRLSNGASGLGIMGLYFFPSGEVLINMKAPEYTRPFTLAHEYAHLVGAVSEADADFLAFLICYTSDDEYIRYSGVLYALEELMNTNEKLYKSVYEKLPVKAKEDLALWQKFCNEYFGKAKSLSDKVNGVYLDSTDKYGRESYSRLSRYVTAYLSRIK